MGHDWVEKWWMDRKRLLQLVVVVGAGGTVSAGV